MSKEKRQFKQIWLFLRDAGINWVKNFVQGSIRMCLDMGSCVRSLRLKANLKSKENIQPMCFDKRIRALEVYVTTT